ncbi:DNA sulfur modification protein DndD [uncultured Acetobacterium sp.]|uniref:DNA sulfur modification protein DndD n=1 Tax=uncultured Acetobacterium sp. TaxID=217139 RepID=UPI0026012968|nr:DNA sulfur modification protein DndD [uncultured Acetobacterium sp.]
MKISKLTLHNFGIYAGTNKLDLQSKKPVVLIGGMNGRGKTTILEAILLAFYGRRSFMYEESGLSFSKYLKQFINKSDGEKSARIELEFNNNQQTYCVIRNWCLNTKTPAFKTIVTKNGSYEKLLSEEWDLFIEEMLPSAVAPFFFFDGEKISDLANTDDDEYMKDSIKSLLGINIVETAIEDIQKIIKSKFKQSKEDNYHINEIEEFDKKLVDADIALKLAKEESGLLDAKSIQIENKLKNAENKFTLVGGELAKKRSALLAKKAHLIGKIEQINSRIFEMTAGDLPLLMTMPLLNKIYKVTSVEKEQRQIQTVLEKLPSLFQEYDAINHLYHNMDDFLDYVKNVCSETAPIYNITDSCNSRIQILCSTILKNQRQKVVEVLSERNQLLAEIVEIENHLSIKVDEKDVEVAYKNIIDLTSQLATLNEQLRSARLIEADCNKKYERLRHQQVQIIEKTVGVMEVLDDVERTIRYAGFSIDVFQEYKKRLQSKKIDVLASTMSDCFKKLVSKEKLLDRIKIDQNTLKFHYYNDSGEEIGYSSFSAGEKQLLVIAMLWALGKCSKKEFPIIIDTPLARLDSVHRKALVTNYFPAASEQMILLSTDEEIYGNLYRTLSPCIDQEYTLKYDEEKKSTSIETGYFGGTLK